MWLGRSGFTVPLNVVFLFGIVRFRTLRLAWCLVTFSSQRKTIVGAGTFGTPLGVLVGASEVLVGAFEVLDEELVGILI